MNENAELAIIFLLAGCVIGQAVALYNHVRECKSVAADIADLKARVNWMEKRK